jgi:hypothetical protein
MYPHGHCMHLVIKKFINKIIVLTCSQIFRSCHRIFGGLTDIYRLHTRTNIHTPTYIHVYVTNLKKSIDYKVLVLAFQMEVAQWALVVSSLVLILPSETWALKVDDSQQQGIPRKGKSKCF